MIDTSTWHWRIVRLGLSQGKFGALIGMHRQQISTYVTGKHTPTERNANLIEDKLKQLELSQGIK